jgi:uncharacterized protein (DUF58 family)
MWLQRIFRPRPANGNNTQPRDVPEMTDEVHLSSSAIRQLDRLQLSGSVWLKGEYIGQRPGQRRKPTSDFMNHRMYVPGDDIRYVDWRASARHEHVFIRQGELPIDITVYLMIDCSASMLWGNVPKYHAQRGLAAALGYLTLVNRDRLKVIPFGTGGNQSLGPISGKGQIANLLKYLNRLNFGGTAKLFPTVKQISRKTSKKGLVFILSDLLDNETISPVLEYFPAPFWMVNVLHLLHPEELTPPLLGNVELVDCETSDSANYDVSRTALKRYRDRLIEWQAHLDMECVAHHAFYTVIPTNWSVQREMIAHLRSTNLVIPK